MASSDTDSVAPLPRGPSTARQMTESLVLLAIAVTLFRAFAAEGYLISTGSMAPTLLGYHRRVTCPHCRFHFERGASIDETALQDDAVHASSGSGLVDSLTACPNCGWDEIDCAEIPRNEGDQLLVHKHAYDLRPPRRWEVVVFRNYDDSNQAYVKRLVGLPGETIELRDGNVHVDGQIQRKPFDVQQAVRVPVSDFDFQPLDDPLWQPAWRIDEGSVDWHADDRLFTFTSSDPTSRTTQWLRFHRWARTGGQHVSAAALQRLPPDVQLPAPGIAGLTYDPARRLLACVGVLSEAELRRWQTRTRDEAFLRALTTLAERSHEAPVNDACGYNAAGVLEEHSVREQMVEFKFDCWKGEGRLDVEMSDGTDQFLATFNYGEETVRLLRNSDPVPLAEARIPEAMWDKAVTITMSLFDEQVTLAVDGQPLFAAVEYVRRAAEPQVATIRIGASGIECDVSHLRVYRDLHYTSKPPHGNQPVQLSSDELYVLGDNSPVSVDSRVWDNPAVPRSALIGKPFLVHLPSRQREFTWGGRKHHMRVPDFSRIRYIR